MDQYQDCSCLFYFGNEVAFRRYPSFSHPHKKWPLGIAGCACGTETLFHSHRFFWKFSRLCLACTGLWWVLKLYMSLKFVKIKILIKNIWRDWLTIHAFRHVRGFHHVIIVTSTIQCFFITDWKVYCMRTIIIFRTIISYLPCIKIFKEILVT